MRHKAGTKNRRAGIISLPMRAAAILCALFFIASGAAYAADDSGKLVSVDPVGRSDNYSAVLYDNTSGLPTSEANALAETDEGFIWIGSYSGLVRYDGNTFERVDFTSTGIGSVIALYTDSKDRLWIGTNESGLFMMDEGELRHWSEDDGLGSAKVNSIAEDDKGNIYAGTTSGIVMILPDMSVHRITDSRIGEEYIEHLTLGSDGKVYGTTIEDDCFIVRNGVLADYLDHSWTEISGITSFYPDPSNPGKVYAGTGESILYYGEPKLEKDNMEATDISPLSGVIDMKKYGDTLWICARNGIGSVDGSGFHYLKELPMNNSVANVMADYEGNLWFASTRQGVMKVAANRFSDVFARYGIDSTVVNSTCVYNDLLLVATDTGLTAIKENDGTVTEMPLNSAVTASGEDLGTRDLIELLDGCRIRSIIRDSKGRLWISTWRGPGLLCYDAGDVTAYTKEDGLLSDHIRAVSETSDGTILVANSGGVSLISEGTVSRSYEKADGIENPEILTVCSAPGGDILLGSNGGGIYVIGKDGTRCIGTGDGLLSGIVMRIKYDEGNRLFWIVTSNSIAYMTEDYKVTTVDRFPYSNNFDLYENSKGDVWVISSNGIYVAPAADLIDNKTINAVHYGLANGMPCTATSNSYSELTAEGNLYIAGSTGVVKVNIEDSLEDIKDIKQSVPFIEADGKMYYPDGRGRFFLPSDAQRITVYGYVYNYSLTDPQVTYQLKGLDKKAVTVARSEMRPVTYTNLRGGTYEFEMVLRDAMGRGSESISVTIYKEPAIYEQAWFILLMAFIAAAALSVAVGAYVRKRVHEAEEKQKAEAERDRISHELTMASNLQRAMMPNEFPPFPDRQEFDIFASMKPAREVGGDFYDYYMIDDDHLCIVMADVSGKGIPAALFMMISKAILKSFANLGMTPAAILTETNDSICSNNRMDMFVTVWLGILEISTGRLTAGNAGHEYPAVMKAGGTFELLKDKHDIVIGGMEGIDYRQYEIDLEPGDRLFLYTDGVPEAADARNNMFGTDRMIKALNIDSDASPRVLLENVYEAVKGFVKGAEQFDDLTMLCLEYNGPSGAISGSDGDEGTDDEQNS